MENKLVVIEIDHLYSIVKQAVYEVIKMEKSEQLKELLNFNETYDFLGIHPSTLINGNLKNKIPYKRLGKRVFFKRQEILESLQNSNFQKYKQITEFNNLNRQIIISQYTLSYANRTT